MSKIAAERTIPFPGSIVEHDLLLAALPHPILVITDDNRIVYGNAAAESFLSTSTTMLTRFKLDDLVAFGCPLLALVQQVREGGSTVNEYGVEMASPKFAAPKLVDVYAGPMSEGVHLIVIMLQQRSMAQMIERQLTHRAAARSVSGMAAVLAHEIKNPLSGIKGAAQLLEQNLSDEDRVLSQLICSETERIRNLVNRMEVFGDERPLTKEPVNIHDVLNHVRRLGESGFARGVRIIEDYDPSLPPIPGNRDKLVQAFLNLLKNAAEAIGDNEDGQGRIIMQTSFRPGVRLSVPGTDARISLPLMIQIEDNGSGVPDHMKPHLFDPFVTTKHNGTGLGLALVAKIIGDHGGIIECDSEAKRTVFRVLLPMQDRTRKDGAVPRPVPANDRRG
ncbi:MAG: two-component sensor histidine kinase [Hyphomicrobium zavarzinii]|uniref:two-component system sensor histidine kinase NtrB n=1 Tax=Hyphomicrobium zavarzinii TaxID=48292 RepID=UPI001A60A899|nr:ATP-binding protein [Hyphomicrobium zavarzinii]MBL8845075.1 two-component sensor histidine kinase [Hyphomicrobium zavarzinii]